MFRYWAGCWPGFSMGLDAEGLASASRYDYRLLARTIRASSFVQVCSLTVPLPMMSPISDIIFDASSGFDCNFPDRTSDTSEPLFIASSAEQAAKAAPCTAAYSMQAAVRVLNINVLHW